MLHISPLPWQGRFYLDFHKTPRFFNTPYSIECSTCWQTTSNQSQPRKVSDRGTCACLDEIICLITKTLNRRRKKQNSILLFTVISQPLKKCIGYVLSPFTKKQEHFGAPVFCVVPSPQGVSVLLPPCGIGGERYHRLGRTP